MAGTEVETFIHGQSGINKINDSIKTYDLLPFTDSQLISISGSNMISDNHKMETSTHGVTGVIVGTDDIQTLENKTITSVGNTLILDAGDITTGTIADAQISVSSITQHQNTIDHNELLNFVSNKHIDHTTVSITGGIGLSGGGDISVNRTLEMDINGLTEESVPDVENDYIAIYDTSGNTHKKTLIKNISKNITITDTVQTTNNTATIITTIPISNNTILAYKGDIYAWDVDQEKSLYQILKVLVSRKDSGNGVVISGETTETIVNKNGWNTNISILGNNMIVTVKGRNGNNIKWNNTYVTYEGGGFV